MLNRSVVVATLAVAAALTLHAQKPRTPATPPAPHADKTVPFRVGETLTYDVSWSTFLTAGTAVATVKEKKPSPGSNAYYIVVEGRPTAMVATLYQLYYKIDTLLDAYTLTPQRASMYSEEGKRHKYKITEFDRRAQRASFEMQSATTVKSTVATPADTQDVLSTLYVLRAMRLGAGDRIAIPVCNDGSIYRLEAQVAATERVTTPLGEMTAFRLNPTIRDDQGRQIGRNIAMWISDDSKRLPLKIQADLPVGTFNLTLRSVG